MLGYKQVVNLKTRESWCRNAELAWCAFGVMAIGWHLPPPR
jgi:hypothetical protein